MKALVAGRTGNSLVRVLGSDISIPVLLTDDNGVPIDISVAVVKAQFFVGPSRAATVSKEITVAPRGGVIGFGDIVISDAEAVLARNTYYVWLYYSLAGDVKIAAVPSTIQFI
jgi:hypothetical protein